MSWGQVTDGLRAAGYCDVAIAAAYGAIFAGESASFAFGVLERAQALVDGGALYDDLLARTRERHREKEESSVQGG